MFLYSVLKVPRATRCEVALRNVLVAPSYSRFTLLCTFVASCSVSLIPRLPISPFDVTNPRFGSGGSPLVGSNGLEPSTSRLSGVRSNHLSYEPISVAGRFHRPNLFAATFRRWWRRTESNCRPPACKAGALPAELRPHIHRFASCWAIPPF